MVKNKEGFNNLPPLPGMLSYREDNEKLYVSKGNKWDEIGSEKEVSCIIIIELYLPTVLFHYKIKHYLQGRDDLPIDLALKYLITSKYNR